MSDQCSLFCDVVNELFGLFNRIGIRLVCLVLIMANKRFVSTTTTIACGADASYQGLKGEVLGALEPRAQSLFLLGAWTKMVILAKWSPKVQPWSPRARIFLSWSLGALNPIGTLSYFQHMK